MFKILPERLNALQDIHLLAGSHAAGQGMCALEAAAWIAGEPHSDRPQCVCPVIAAFVRTWNDSLHTDAERDRLLKPLLPAMVGTRSSKSVEDARSFLALDWSVRVMLPTWLEACGQQYVAAALRASPAIADGCGLDAIAPLLVDVARIAARDALAALDAALDDTLSAARNAARIATRDAAIVAARNAAPDDTLSAAHVASLVAALDAALDAAYAVAMSARDKLGPVVAQLQASAAELVVRMCEVGRNP